MILNVYGLRDRVAGAYRSLSLNEKDEVERRNLAYAVNNDSHMMFMAKDFELYCIGQLDSETGVLIPQVPARMICQADQLIGAEGRVNNEI